ncbi:putative replication factor A2 [Blattamonas nauphoetae]|uniref:Replication factor A2 n=1 Tax=Blattamonas nauphoetae TaxID=2049346 RepID=A0ABQ9Y4B9_9EUKA|nr:putative replication factor A2 [Blattamonas nauphoetae]
MDADLQSPRRRYQSNNQDGQNQRQQLEDSTLIPLSVKMVLAAQKEFATQPFTIDGQDITNIQILALILESVSRGPALEYTLDDGTASVVGKNYHPQMIDANTPELIESGVYVRVYGTIIQTQEKNEINIQRITRVTNFNDVTSHLLTVIHAHLLRTSSAAVLTSQPAIDHLSSPITSPPMSAAFHMESLTPHTPNRSMDQTITPPRQQNLTRREMCLQDVLQFIQENTEPDGHTAMDIAGALLGKYPEYEIKEALTTLYDNAQVTIGLTMDHYACI